ncbi:DEAD/DEAH box helicase [Methanobacterium alcaliphilum]|uniref:DEAD/DEAH box helicase n=1 Tax=Methanobacterium alcaliphilum TaxID=392018 RepID=UPI00200A32D4|nr:DEAD/DEAH box helicase [Methanobacterium alcaliphilum]MCK9152032.1 DEAD/DEAH box helicase [Methanobacterium alcaliphilum]
MIILRKKKKILELYPIGSPKGALNSRRKPEFYGYIKFKRTPSALKINRFVVKKDKEEVLPPAEAVKLFRKQAVFLVEKDAETQEFLESLNIKFRRTRICHHCTLEGNITIINSKSSFKYHDQNICRLCAEEVIKREIKYRGLDKKTFKNFKRILDKTGNLDVVLKVLDPNFDPIKNSNLTLFDKITTSSDKDMPKLNIEQLNIPEKFKISLKRQGSKTLLPVQYLAVDNGLLEGESMLVVSATASGKTLIGELAGIPRALNGEKFIFLTPLVALANQKYRDFKKRYSNLGLKPAIKVGMSRIKAREEIKLPEEKIKDSDIIVGTYEGIDFMLRSGKSFLLENLGTVVIDEIHMLDDEERGPRLNGLIKRLKTLFPNIQLIGLSATVQNPQEIAHAFGLKLVEYDRRPVPLERHLVFTRSEEEKKSLIARFSRQEFKNKSNKGFHGQTIIFTNSRRKTHLIANYLNRNRLNAAAYHAGLSYFQKERIEKDFAKQEISTVVTTAALAAGVDFPASQVIFETLTMGNKWITPNEFSQMLGRAGRPSYHDRGIVYLLPEIGLSFEDETEEAKALQLLESDVDPVNVYYSEDDSLEHVLADVCAGSVSSTEQLSKIYAGVPLPIDPAKAIGILESYGLLKIDKGIIKHTDYGKAVAMSFLNVEDAEYIRTHLKKKSKKSPLEIALSLEPFESAYLSSRIHTQLSRALKTNFSTRLFADSTLDIISSGENLAKLDHNFQQALINIQMDFLTCKCKDRPFCNCLQDELSLKIIKQRLKKQDPVDITRRLLQKYQIHAYPGDIFSWLDSIVRTLDAVRRVALAFNNHKKAKECLKIIKIIEKG